MPESEDQQEHDRLDLHDLVQPCPHAADHHVAHVVDMAQRRAAAHCVVEAVVVLDEIRFDPHEKGCHAGHHAHVCNEHGNIVDHRRMQRSDHARAGVRRVPEHEFVDPHAKVEQQSDERKTRIREAFLQHLERHGVAS